MSYEKRDAVLTKVWRAVRDFKLKLDDASHRILLKDMVALALASIEPDAETTMLSYVDGSCYLKWTGFDEIIRIRREEGVMEVRVGL